MFRDESESESEKSVQRGWCKRYAKSEQEMIKDILNLFKRKPHWTMNEIKDEMPDQPDKPVE